MATQLEKRLQHIERTAGGVLVPLFEDYHKKFHSNHWDKDDIEFLHDLMDRVAEREKERGTEPVFSPSGLGGCQRQVFLHRNAEKLGIPRKIFKKIETHFYFEYGTWLHLKIQVKLYKLHKEGELELLGTEIAVASKHGDNRGTLDTVFRRDDVFAIDIKGWNQRDFFRLAGGDCPLPAQIQLANYIILANASKGTSLPRIDRGIVLAENKAGPVAGYPAAVAEFEIPLYQAKLLVRQRLERLRAHEKEGSTPEAECRSTAKTDFKECAFRDYCKKEVEKAEKRGRRSKSRDTTGHTVKVATPNRSDRARRHSKR